MAKMRVNYTGSDSNKEGTYRKLTHTTQFLWVMTGYFDQPAIEDQHKLNFSFAIVGNTMLLKNIQLVVLLVAKGKASAVPAPWVPQLECFQTRALASSQYYSIFFPKQILFMKVVNTQLTEGRRVDAYVFLTALNKGPNTVFYRFPSEFTVETPNLLLTVPLKTPGVGQNF